MKKIIINGILSILLTATFTGKGIAECCPHHHNHGEMKQHFEQMMTEIGVNCEQKQKIDTIMQTSELQRNELHKTLHQKKKALFEYMITPQATKEQALCLQKEVNSLQLQMHEMHLNSFFEIKKILTPEQQQKMYEYHQKHRQDFHKNHPCPLK